MFQKKYALHLIRNVAPRKKLISIALGLLRSIAQKLKYGGKTRQDKKDNKDEQNMVYETAPASRSCARLKSLYNFWTISNLNGHYVVFWLCSQDYVEEVRQLLLHTSSLLADVAKDSQHSVYSRSVSFLLNLFNLLYGPLGRLTCTLHSISAHFCQEGIKSTKSQL